MKLAHAVAIAGLDCSRKLHGRIVFQGLLVSVENRKGSVREGVDNEGKPWKVRMTWPYGYIRGSLGVDGDHVDCFIGPNPQADTVYVVHTKNPSTGKYDEDKCMLGWDSADDAKQAFLANYTSADFFGSMDEIPFSKFKEKVLTTSSRPQKIVAMSRLESAALLAQDQPGGT